MNSDNFQIKLSVITVTLNAQDSLRDTLQSVKSQKSRDRVKFIVIDGFSDDGSLALLEGNRADIDSLYIEKDRGVYDAMNKAVKLSSTEWIYFLNAGDIFLSDDSLCKIINEIDDSDVLYSNVVVDSANGRYEFDTSFEKRILNHQGFVYRKDLHQRFGLYPVIKGFTAADYFFFLLLDGLKVKKLDTPIAIFKTGGLSSTVNAVHQKYCLDFLAGKIGALNLSIRLIIYPGYRLLKNFISWIRQR